MSGFDWAAVFKALWGTDAQCQNEAAAMQKGSKKDGHITEALASHAEQKIERMNAATERLSRVNPAANLSEALQQLIHRR